MKQHIPNVNSHNLCELQRLLTEMGTIAEKLNAYNQYLSVAEKQQLGKDFRELRGREVSAFSSIKQYWENCNVNCTLMNNVRSWFVINVYNSVVAAHRPLHTGDQRLQQCSCCSPSTAYW